MMARSFEVAFDSWFSSLGAQGKDALRGFSCGYLASLRYAKLDSNLIYAAVGFWDPCTHCFRFRDREITPLPEELGAVVHIAYGSSPCLPDIGDYFYRDYERYLGLDSRSLGKILHGREIDLVALVDHFSNNSSRKVYRNRALLLCLFSRFLFVNNDPSVGHASIISIVEQFEQGKSPMPLCAGELFLSLDRIKRDSHAPLTGCPLLLQVTYSFFFFFLHDGLMLLAGVVDGALAFDGAPS